MLIKQPTKLYKCYYSIDSNSKLMYKPWLNQDFCCLTGSLCAMQSEND